MQGLPIGSRTERERIVYFPPAYSLLQPHKVGQKRLQDTNVDAHLKRARLEMELPDNRKHKRTEYDGDKYQAAKRGRADECNRNQSIHKRKLLSEDFEEVVDGQSPPHKKNRFATILKRKRQTDEGSGKNDTFVTDLRPEKNRSIRHKPNPIDPQLPQFNCWNWWKVPYYGSIEDEEELEYSHFAP